VGAKGGRGRMVPVIDLATHVKQLRRDVLQHSLQTNWRHSWQKRKLWTKDWYASSSILARSCLRAVSYPAATPSWYRKNRPSPIENAWNLPGMLSVRLDGGSTNRVLHRSHAY